MASAGTFSCFRKLPIELQLWVWKYAAEDPAPAYHPLQSIHNASGRYAYPAALSQVHSRPPVPPLLHACHDSRVAALKTYTIIKEIKRYVAKKGIWFQRYGELGVNQQGDIFTYLEDTMTRPRYVHFRVDHVVHFPINHARDPFWAFLGNRHHEYNFKRDDLQKFRNMLVLDENSAFTAQFVAWNHRPFSGVKNLQVVAIVDADVFRAMISKMHPKNSSNIDSGYEFKKQMWMVKLPNCTHTHVCKNVEDGTEVCDTAPPLAAAR